MSFDRVERKVLKSEGEIKNRQGMHIAYQDHKKIWTIGHGSTRLFGLPVTMNTKPINDEQAMIQFRHDIYFAIKDASNLIRSFQTVGKVRQEALIEMCYQLGGPSARGFNGMIKAANKRNWLRAAQEMIYNIVEEETPSKWYLDTPARCLELAEMVETNKHPWGNS